MIKEAEFVGSYTNAQRIPSDGRPQIAFAGRSNVGKSSLLNKLTNRKRLAKTSKTPGRTRQLNFFLINKSYYFVDLPGYGYAKAPTKEKEAWSRLIDEYLETSEYLRGLVFLIDCRRDPTEDDLMMLDWLKAKEIAYTIVLTKADKLSRNNLINRTIRLAKTFGIEPIPFSIISGVGKKELTSWIEKTVKNRSKT